jgi:hypothetical protein
MTVTFRFIPFRFRQRLPLPLILAPKARAAGRAAGIIIYQLHLLEVHSNLAAGRLRGASETADNDACNHGVDETGGARDACLVAGTAV